MNQSREELETAKAHAYEVMYTAYDLQDKKLLQSSLRQITELSDKIFILDMLKMHELANRRGR